MGVELVHWELIVLLGNVAGKEAGRTKPSATQGTWNSSNDARFSS